jgi:hypothetical protein
MGPMNDDQPNFTVVLQKNRSFKALQVRHKLGHRTVYVIDLTNSG